MANLPEKSTSSSTLATRNEFSERIADLMADGWTIGRIARKLYPNDPRKQKNLRQRIRYMTYTDPNFTLAVGQRAKGQMVMDLIPTAIAVGNRAKRGRIDAAKLVMEATGFHNPKIKHEHSGDINIRIEMPRPKFHEAEGSTDLDADVVD